MTREERKEFTVIKNNLKKYELTYGTTLTIRTDASASYKKALDELYTSLDFHPASVTIDSSRFDGKERILYIKGIVTDGYHWTELYSKKEREFFAAKLEQETPVIKEKKAPRPKDEVRYIVTDCVSIPVYRSRKKGEMYRMATEPEYGVVCRDYETQDIFCDEDCSSELYTKDGQYFGIYPYDEIKPMPKQADVDVIIVSDSCGFSFWESEIGKVKIFVTYTADGLIDNYRLDVCNTIYDGETEIRFEDLQSAEDYEKTDRSEIVGTFEHYNSMSEAS